MGGNAIRPLAEKHGFNTTRLTRELAEHTQRHIETLLGLVLLQPKTFPTKKDFGDLDLLGDFRSFSQEEIKKRIGAVGFVKNGHVTSYALPYESNLLQVDLINVHLRNMGFVSRYMAWGGAENFFGKVSRHYGMKFSADGLYAKQVESGQIYFLPVTKSFGEAMKILDYDFDRFEKGFYGEENFLEFVRSSRLFREEFFSVENLRARDTGNEHRNNAFRNLSKSKKNQNNAFAIKEATGNITLPDFSRYPLFLDALTELREGLEKKRLIAKKWNGDMVSSITGLTEKDLGRFMAEFSSRFSSASEFQSWILLTPEETVRMAVLDAYASRGIPEGLSRIER